MSDVAGPRVGRWRLFARWKTRRSLALALLLAFFGGNLATIAAAAGPPRKPPKKTAAKKPPSQRGKKAGAKKGTKKPAKRPGAKAKISVGGKSKPSGKGTSSAPSKRLGAKSGSGKKPAAQQAKKPSGQRKTLSGVSGRKVTSKDVRATSQRLKAAGKTRPRVDRAPLSSKRRSEVKDRLARARAGSTSKSSRAKLPAVRPPLRFDKKNIRKQMAERGWTEKLIRSTRDNPVKTYQTTDHRTKRGVPGRRYEPATAYYSARGGYVVINNRTGDVIQVSRRNGPWKKPPWEK